MHKKFLIIFIILFLLITTTSCNKPKTLVLFNKDPITKENLLNNTNDFIAQKRIYYLFITEKKLNTDSIRVRILKKDGKAVVQPISVVYSNDFRLKKDQIFYYNDYIIMNSPGEYCMLIYAKNALNKPLVMADFRVKD